MKKVIVLSLVLFCASFALAQTKTSKVSVFGGYQYLSVDMKAGDRINTNGWDADVAFNVKKNVAIVADFSGAYKNEDASALVGQSATARFRLYNILFGPRVQAPGKISPFAEALFGVGHVSIGATSGGVSANVSNNNFAMALGGGLDIKANRNLSIRLAKFDYVLNRVGGDLGDNETLNNFRVATGVVFHF